MYANSKNHFLNRYLNQFIIMTGELKFFHTVKQGSGSATQVMLN